MLIYALDPGPAQSAIVGWDGQKLHVAEKLDNADLLAETIPGRGLVLEPGLLIIEQVASYGMAVGAEVFETVFFSGRMAQLWPWGFERMPRLMVKQHICHDSRAKDSNVRQALVDRFGPPDTKKAPNPVHNGFKVSKDVWQAWALAVTWWDQYCDCRENYI